MDGGGVGVGGRGELGRGALRGGAAVGRQREKAPAGGGQFKARRRWRPCSVPGAECCVPGETAGPTSAAHERRRRAFGALVRDGQANQLLGPRPGPKQLPHGAGRCRRLRTALRGCRRRSAKTLRLGPWHRLRAAPQWLAGHTSAAGGPNPSPGWCGRGVGSRRGVWGRGVAVNWQAGRESSAE